MAQPEVSRTSILCTFKSGHGYQLQKHHLTFYKDVVYCPMSLKRYDVKTLLSDPWIRRKMVCEGTQTTMAREGVDISLDMIYDMYDKYTSKGLRLPDDYNWSE